MWTRIVTGRIKIPKAIKLSGQDCLGQKRREKHESVSILLKMMIIFLSSGVEFSTSTKS